MQIFPIILIVISHILVDTTQSSLSILLPVARETFGLNYTQVGIVAGTLFVTSSVIQPLFGYLADRWQANWFMAVGVGWTALVMGLVGTAPTYGVLLLLVGLAGLGTAAFHPQAGISVANLSPARRGLGMSFFSAGGNVGFALGPLVGAWILSRFHLRGTLLFVIPGLFMGGLLFGLRRITCPVEKSAEGPRGMVRVGMGRLVDLGLLSVVTALRSWTYTGTMAFLPLYLTARGAALTVSGRYLFLFLLAGAVGGLAGGFLSDRVGRIPVIAISHGIFPFAMGAFLLLEGPWRLLMLAGAGASLLASFSVIVVLAQELLPERMGMVSGLVFGLAFGTGGLGVGLSGLVADAWGLGPVMAVHTILPAFASVLALFIRGGRRIA